MEMEGLSNYFKEGGIDVMYTDRGLLADRDPYRYAIRGFKIRTRNPIQHARVGYFPQEEAQREIRRRHLIGWAQVIITFAIIALLIIGICSITVPGKAEEAIGFPSFWRHDWSQVRSVQSGLNRYDHADLTVDGDFGPLTAQAVKSYQARHGLAITGVADEELIKMLGYNCTKGTTMYYMADLESIYAKSEFEDILYISLGGRSRSAHFSIFRDGILVAETECIVGNEYYNEGTPVGVFKVGKKSPRQSGESYEFYNVLWLTKNGQNTDISIHSLLAFYSEADDCQVLGEHQSNGDILVNFDLADWLYKNVSVGTTVVIDDRNYQPSSIGYEALISDESYADWD